MTTPNQQPEGTSPNDSRQTSSGCYESPAPMAAGAAREQTAEPLVNVEPRAASDGEGGAEWAEIEQLRHELMVTKASERFNGLYARAYELERDELRGQIEVAEAARDNALAELAYVRLQRDALLEMTWLDLPDEPSESTARWREEFAKGWERKAGGGGAEPGEMCVATSATEQPEPAKSGAVVIGSSADAKVSDGPAGRSDTE